MGAVKKISMAFLPIIVGFLIAGAAGFSSNPISICNRPAVSTRSSSYRVLSVSRDENAAAVERVQPGYPKPLAGMHSQYPFENFVFQGGGTKGIIYCGAIQALEELGILPHAKRAAAASAGCAPALFLCLGLNAKQVEEETNKLEMADFFDGKEGPLPFAKMYVQANSIYKNLGVHPCSHGLEYFGDICEKYAGNRDVTFKQIYNKFGRELCIAVSNISRHQTEYCHVITTPDMPVRNAIRASMSLPILWEPFELNEGEKYVDGGWFNNFPLKAFDGWFLSTKPGDDVLSQIANSRPELYKEGTVPPSYELLKQYNDVMANSFEEPNMATVGFRAVDDQSAEDASYAVWAKVVEQKMRSQQNNLEDIKERELEREIPLPDTKYGRDYQKQLEIAEKVIEDTSKYDFALAEMINWSACQIGVFFADPVVDHPHAIKADLMLKQLYKFPPKEFTPELFDCKNWEELVAQLDKAGKGYITRVDIAKFGESRGVRNAFQKNRKPRTINNIRSMVVETLQSILTFNDETLLRVPVNAERVCTLHTKYIGLLNLDMEQGDKDYLYALGKRETLGWLKAASANIKKSAEIDEQKMMEDIKIEVHKSSTKGEVNEAQGLIRRLFSIVNVR